MPQFITNRFAYPLFFAAFLMAAVYLLLTSSAQAAGIIFVDKDATVGGNTGADWPNAYTDLQSALTAATVGDEIWVAEGVYIPGAAAGDTFQLKDNVAIYGGFVGTESNRVDRDWDANVTVLSGDIGGDDTADGNGVVASADDQSGANSFNVVTSDGLTAGVILDGFTITAGQANSAPNFPKFLGGGLHNDGSNTILANIVFSGNKAASGGAIISNPDSSVLSDLTLTNVSFTGNSAIRGGAIFNAMSSTLRITDGAFQNNQSTNDGGAVFSAESSSLAILNTVFTDNQSLGTGNLAGGGGLLSENSDLLMENVLFAGNSAKRGGGWRNQSSTSTPKLVNVAFIGNYAGGASAQGGGLYSNNGSPILINVTVAGNRAEGTLANPSLGGGMFFANPGPSRPTIVNTIIWGNQDSSGVGTASASIATIIATEMPNISYSIIQGSDNNGNWQSAIGVDGGNNLDSDPMFVTTFDPADAPSTAGNARLKSGSPAINSGNNGAYTAASSVMTDLGGEARFQNVTIDRGAYEGALPILSISFAGALSGGSVSGLSSGVCTADCQESISAGETVTLTATPAALHTFTGWSGACSGMGQCVVTINADTSVTATFAQSGVSNYEITTSTSGNGSGTITKSPDAASYPDGTMVTLTATPASGSQFLGWSGDCTGLGNCLLMMDSDKDATAIFGLIGSASYKITTVFAGTGDGDISKSPDAISYPDGTVVTMTATPFAGSEFAGWSGPCTGMGSCVVTMDSDKTVTATFNEIVGNSYSLTTMTAGSGSGTIIRSPDAPTYADGTMVTLTPDPSSSSTFSGWSGACSGTGSCVVTMDADKSVTATFDGIVGNSYSLTTMTAGSGSGTISRSPNASTYPDGAMVTLTPNPAAGSTFTGWSGACTGSGSCVVTMDADKSVTATFTADSLPPPSNFIYLPLVTR